MKFFHRKKRHFFFVVYQLSYLPLFFQGGIHPVPRAATRSMHHLSLTSYPSYLPRVCLRVIDADISSYDMFLHLLSPAGAHTALGKGAGVCSILCIISRILYQAPIQSTCANQLEVVRLHVS